MLRTFTIKFAREPKEMNNANSNFKKGKKHIEAYIFFLIAALVVTGCSDAQTTADLIDKWNQIIVVQ